MWTFKKNIFRLENSLPTIGCGGTISTSGFSGIYEILLNPGSDIGITGIRGDSQNIPDRFQLYYDDVLVADSKFIGGNLFVGPPVDIDGGTLLGNYDLDVYEFNGIDFTATGEVRNIDVIQADIADNITEPTDGNTFLYFNKTTIEPLTIKLVITGLSPTTAWELNEFICPFDESLIPDGSEVFVYGFLPEAEKVNNQTPLGKAISKKLYLGTTPVKFYCDLRGDATYFVNLGWTATNRFINDGTTWYELDISGNIISSGLI